MLAWVHQAVASERLILTSLLEPESSGTFDAKGKGAGILSSATSAAVMNRSFGPVCQILKVINGLCFQK